MQTTGRARVRAFSLIEALVAMVVLLVGVLTLTTAYPYAFGRIGERDDELQAVSFGQQYIEQVREQIRAGATALTPGTAPIDGGYPLAFGVMGYPAPGSTASPPPQLASPGTFTATATTNPALSAGASSYDVTVKVTWTYGGSPRQVLLETIITRE
jgi:type II secretory pathway pseudopilin PulG